MSDDPINAVIESIQLSDYQNIKNVTRQLSVSDKVLLYVLLELRKLNANFERAYPPAPAPSSGGKKTTKRVSSARKAKEVK